MKGKIVIKRPPIWMRSNLFKPFWCSLNHQGPTSAQVTYHASRDFGVTRSGLQLRRKPTSARKRKEKSCRMHASPMAIYPGVFGVVSCPTGVPRKHFQKVKGPKTSKNTPAHNHPQPFKQSNSNDSSESKF